MMRRGSAGFAALAILVAFAPADAGEIAVTLDDLPYLAPPGTSPQKGLAYVELVNRALAAHGIEAVGFVVGNQIRDKTLPALQAFVEAGHTLGNHSWSHPDYGTLTIDAFREEPRLTDEALSPWLGERKYYRFPYLREGETEAAKAAATAVLAEFGYTNVPVSIDNQEWRFNNEYVLALQAGDVAAAEQIAERYLAHMRERTDHFQRLAREALGRDVTHILLLHMNPINADYLGALLDWYAAEGWRFVTVEEAISDPLYSAPDLYAGPRGLSQIERFMGRSSD
ncbi:MAG: polysaccharide deacetylase family protein [Pseudomonadota bacterium]